MISAEPVGPVVIETASSPLELALLSLSEDLLFTLDNSLVPASTSTTDLVVYAAPSALKYDRIPAPTDLIVAPDFSL